MRDDAWLLSRLDYLWSNYFTDVPQLNAVFISFGRFARLRFGSIRLDPSTHSSPRTIITITSMFKDETIPVDVIDHTIAHELCHYAHGFSSPHARLHKYPHEGGVVKKEMERRGLIYLYKTYQKWVKDYREELRAYYQGKRRARWGW